MPSAVMDAASSTVSAINLASVAVDSAGRVPTVHSVRDYLAVHTDRAILLSNVTASLDGRDCFVSDVSAGLSVDSETVYRNTA